MQSYIDFLPLLYSHTPASIEEGELEINIKVVVAFLVDLPNGLSNKKQEGKKEGFLFQNKIHRRLYL
jgi:hypothetical protein